MKTKYKAKPNCPIGLINNIKKEKGITLIALIIMVLLLIILAMISIKAVTGKEGIFVSSSNITNEYVVQQYGEQIEQLVHSIILKDSLLRKINNKTKHGRRYGKRRLDKKCSAR